MQQSQSGSALITALIFLIVLTILGLSTMTTSRLEVRMAANTQFAHQAFQAAESGIEQVLDTIEADATNALLDTTSAVGTTVEHYYNEDTTGSFTNPNDSKKYVQKTTANILYQTKSDAPEGSSFSGPVASYHFRILSTGESSFGGESQSVQGFYKLGPG